MFGFLGFYGFLFFKQVKDGLAPAHVFFGRVIANLVAACLLIAGSLVGGMWGYHQFESESWLDAFADAAMILSGMGPLSPLHTPEGKVFAGCYALYSGLVLIAASSLILAPVLHRFLHSMHVDDNAD